VTSFPHTHLQGRVKVFINVLNEMFWYQVLVYGQRSFEIKQLFNIYSMVNHMILIINLKIDFQNQFNCFLLVLFLFYFLFSIIMIFFIG
jgi:hypothetical protein